MDNNSKVFDISIESNMSHARKNEHAEIKTLVSLKQMNSYLPRNEDIPVNIFLLIDTSSSMNDQGKLLIMKECLKYFITSLRRYENKNYSIISFDDIARVVRKLGPIDEDLSWVNHLEAKGSRTNISDAVLKADDIIRNESTECTVVMLFTDGFANAGITDIFFLNETLAQMKPKYPIFTFGFGHNHNSSLLCRISDYSRGGTYSYVERVDSITDYFDPIIKIITDIVATDVVLELNYMDGCRNILFGFNKNPQHKAKTIERQGGINKVIRDTIKLGFITSGETKNIPLVLNIRETMLDVHKLMAVKVLYTNAFGKFMETSLTLEITRDLYKRTEICVLHTECQCEFARYFYTKACNLWIDGTSKKTYHNKTQDGIKQTIIDFDNTVTSTICDRCIMFRNEIVDLINLMNKNGIRSCDSYQKISNGSYFSRERCNGPMKHVDKMLWKYCLKNKC